MCSLKLCIRFPVPLGTFILNAVSYIDDPKHTSKKATKWFEDNNINVMAWPAQSPDLNPIEHLWVDLKKALKEYPNHPRECMSCGRGWWKSGIKSHQKHDKTL